MPEIVDLTLPLSGETRVFPGYPRPIIHKWTTIKEEGYYSNMVFMVEHSGTHVDSPAHFVEGAPTIDEVPPSKFVAEGVVLDFTSKEPGQAITAGEIREALGKLGVESGRGLYLLIAMGWDTAPDDVWLKYPYLTEDAARLIASMGFEGIGLDSPSPDYAPFMVHKILLPQGILIVENMAGLTRLAGQRFKMIMAPMKIKGGSAAPVRVLAILE